MNKSIRSVGRSASVNVLILAGTWALALALVQLTRLASTHWSIPTLSMLAAAVLGALGAIHLRARVAGFFLVVVIAVLVAEIGIHSAFGAHVVQGRESHLAIIAAALVAVYLGMLLGRAQRGTGPSQQHG